MICDLLEMMLIAAYVVLDQLFTKYPMDTCALGMGLATFISLCLALCKCQKVVTVNQWKVGLGLVTLLKSTLFCVVMIGRVLAPDRAIWVQVLGYLVLTPLMLTGSVFYLAQVVEAVMNPDHLVGNDVNNAGLEDGVVRADESEYNREGHQEVRERVKYLGEDYVDIELKRSTGDTRLCTTEMDGGFMKHREYLI